MNTTYLSLMDLRKNIRNILKESAGISFEVREWSNILYELLNQSNGNRLIVDGSEYPEIYKHFSVDYFVIDYNDWVNGYLDKTSGYDSDGNYVVHIMVLNKFKHHEYMKTILNHEIKHAYQDWQRIRKGYSSIANTKESLNLYTDDFIKAVKDRVSIGSFFKDILKGYYLLSDLELNAFVENVYDRDMINDYKKMVSKLTDFDAHKATYYEDPYRLEKDWKTLTSLDIPLLKKYKDYNSFLVKTTEYFNRRSSDIIRKLNKMEYVHRDR